MHQHHPKRVSYALHRGGKTATMPVGGGVFQRHDSLMEPLSYPSSVVGGNIAKQRTAVFSWVQVNGENHTWEVGGGGKQVATARLNAERRSTQGPVPCLTVLVGRAEELC